MKVGAYIAIWKGRKAITGPFRECHAQIPIMNFSPTVGIVLLILAMGAIVLVAFNVRDGWRHRDD